MEEDFDKMELLDSFVYKYLIVFGQINRRISYESNSKASTD